MSVTENPTAERARGNRAVHGVTYNHNDCSECVALFKQQTGAVEDFREAACRALLSNERLKELVGVNERAWVASLIRALPGREG